MSASKVELSGGAFQDALGNPVNKGYLLMQLSQDAQVTGASPEILIAAGRIIRINLDSSGNIITSPAQDVWPNDVLTPANTFYTVKGYSAAGQLVWGPNAQQVLSTPSPYNVGQGWSPARVNFSTTAVTTYDIGVFFPGLYTSSQVILLLPLERTVTFASNLSPSQAACGINPTSTAVFTLSKNGASFGTLSISTSGVGTFSSTTGVTFSAGDVLTIIAPSTADSALANVGITLSGTTAGGGAQ